MSQAVSYLIALVAGLWGAAGVALAAIAAHRLDDPALPSAAYMLLFSAAAAAAVTALAQRCRHPRLFTLSAALLLAGAALFSGDIAMRAATGARLFPYAAPMGGSTMIAGWLMLAAGAIAELRSART